LFQRLSADRAAFLDFFEEANELVSKITAGIGSSETEKRWVHTLKGNAGMFGMTAIAGLCHELETRMAEESRPLNAEERERVGAVWAELRARVSGLIGEKRKSFVEVDQTELDAVIAMVEGDVQRKTIAATLRSFSLEPVRLRFERLAEQAKHLAARLGKSELEVRIDSGLVRLESDAWRPFWSAFVHAIRNAVDHGIEDAELRRANNKPGAGTLSLTAKNENDGVTITLSDDGRGIDWARTRARAERLGLAADNTGDLRAALFKDGFTTRETASDVSGRGVGLGALREATEALGGSVHVRSIAGHGTEFEFRFRTP
jgi:two-component system, chemotaxis family, sensor kinase CheA